MRYQRSATNAFLALGLSAIFPIATSASSPSSVGNRNLKNVFNNDGSGGSTGGPPGQGQKETNSLECTLLLSQDLPIHASENEISNSSTSTSSEDDNDSDTSIVCIMDPADTDGIPGMMRTIEGTAEQIEEIKSKFARGEMRSGEAKLVHGKGVGFDKKSMFLPKELAIKDSVKQSNEHSRKKGDGIRTRRLANTLGDKPILAVRVIDSTGLAHSDNASTMSSNIFGTNGNDPVNLKSQLSACSFDQLTVVPGLTGTVEGNDKNEEALGVVEVTIPLDITSTTDDVLSRLDVLNAVTTAVQAKLGFELPGPYDHLMYILEGCYGDDCGWAAYAYINSVLSVYQGDYYQMAGVQLHELGHNLNLAHSGGVNSLPYSDHTCLMGNPLYSDDVGKMCFNPAKNWQLNWYGNNNGKKLIDPTDINWQHEEVTMVGIAEYNLKSADQPVTIKLETGSSSGNYFIGFNRKTGANSESVDGGDSVTITRVSTGNGEDYSQSYLMAVIAQGEEYTIADVAAWDTPLTIKVDTIDIDTTGTTDPGIAVICVTKTGNCNGNGNSSPKSPNKPPTPNSTPPPTSSQTNNPTLVSNACDAVVPNVLLPQDTVETFGCITETTPGNAYDGNTNSFECEKDPAENKRKHGLIISNVADRLSIVEKLRVYASADCEGCDPVKFKVEGRGGLNCMRINNIDVAEMEAFKLIKKGDLLWIDDAPGITRNAAGEDIDSTYAAGDPNKSYTEIDLENSSTEGPAECRDYRITFTYTRLDEVATPIRVGEVELVGRITSACPTVPPNQAPPTGTPTSSPTVSNKPSTSLVPSVAPTVTTAPSCGRDEVATVFLPGDTVETSGCTSVSSPGNAYDGTTNEFQCVKDPAVAADTRKHEIIISNDGRTSIVEKLRVYANSDCQECDAVTYKVEGRGGPNCNRINNIELEGIAEMEAFKLIKKGDLPWANATGTIGRNAVGEDIVSTYAEGGVGKSYTEVSLDNFGTEGPAECRDYRITFKYTRLDTAATPIKVGEIELVGRVDNCPTPAPETVATPSPTSGSTTPPPTASVMPSTSSVPSVAPSISSAPSCEVLEVASVFLPGDTVETSGCTSVSSPGNAYDGTTNEFQCVKDPAVAADTRKHEIIISNDGRTSIVEKLRVYANSDCQECDAVTYKVEGRGGPNCNRINNIELEGIAEMEAFKLIKKGDLPWANATGTIGRNAVGEDIVSTYAEGGVGKSYTEVSLDNFGTEGPAECRDYRITFKYTRLDTAATPIEVGEIELVGKITNACVTPSPTPACSDNIIRRNCRRVTGCSWKNKQCIVG